MSDNTIDVSIRTKADTSGTKEAAAGLAAVEKQAAATGAALDGMAEAAGGGTGGAASGAAAGTAGAPRARGGRSRGKGAAAAMKEMAQEAPKAAAGSRNLGAAIGQAGFQVQDFAVQVGAGTSAVTAFAQQGSQLLGIFGPGGAIAGALLAAGAAAYRIFETTQEGSEDAAAAAEELEKSLAKVREEMAAAISARETTSLEGFARSLEGEADSYVRINDELARNISLMQARRRAQAEIDSAQAALDLARIDADGGMTEEQKIRARAEVEQRLEQQRFQGRVAEAGERVALAESDFRTRSEAARLASEAATKARRALDDAQAERDRLAPRVEAARRLPAERQSLAAATQQVRAFEEDGELQDGVKPRPAVRAALKWERVARERVARLEAIVAASDEEIARFAALESTILAERTKLAEDRLRAEEDARRAAADAAAKRDQIAAEMASETAAAANTFELNRQTRQLTTDVRANAASEERRRREEDEARRAAERRDGRGAFGREGEGIADSLVAGASNDRQRAALEQIGNRIAARPDTGLAELTDAIEAMMRSADEARARELRRATERISRLEAKMRTTRDAQ